MARPNSAGTFQATTYAYDPLGTVSSVTDPLGDVTAYARDELLRITSVTPPGTGAVPYQLGYYPNSMQLQTATNGAGEMNRRGANTASGDTRYVVDPLNEALRAGGTSAYDATTFTHDASGNVLAATTSNYAAGSDLENDPFPASASEHRRVEFDYTTGGLLDTMTDPLGRETRFEYDTATGYLTEISTEPGDGESTRRVTTFIRNPDGSVDTMTDPEGLVTEYAYDGLGRLTDIAYDHAGPDYASAVSALEPEVYYRFNEGSGTTATDASGNGNHATYQGDIGLGEPGLLAEDADTAALFDGSSTSVTRQELALVVHTSVAWFRRDGLPHGSGSNSYHSLVMAVQGNAGHLYLTDDGDRILYQIRNASGVTQSLSYTLPEPVDVGESHMYAASCDGTTARIYFDGQLVASADIPGNTAGTTDLVIGRSTAANAYHGNGVIDEVAIFDRALTDAQLAGLYAAGTRAGFTVSYDLDANGNLVAMDDAAGETDWTYDANNRVSAESRTQAGTSKSAAYAYFANGTLQSLTTFAGQTVSFSYDHALRLTAQTDPKNGGGSIAFGYDERSRRTTITYPSGVNHTQAFDAGGRTASITLEQADGTDLQKFSYGYGFDANGTRTADYAFGFVTGVTELSGATVSYEYDELARLVGAERTGTGTGAFDQTYAYDDANNRTSFTDGATTTTFTYDAANQLISDGTDTYSYDRNANLTAFGSNTLAYDGANKWTSGSVGGTSLAYAYDGLGRQVSRTEGVSTRTDLWFDQTGLTLESGASTLTYLRDPGGLPLSVHSGASVRNVGRDRLGSVTALTSTAQAIQRSYTYDPYGTIVHQTGSASNSLKFTAGRQDPSSTWYTLGQRTYAPGLARFTTLDPLPASITDLNRHAYASCNPANFVDPMGLECSTAETIGRIGAGIFLAAVGVGILALGGVVIFAGITAVATEASLLIGAVSLLEGIGYGGLIAGSGLVTSFVGGFLIGGLFGGC